MLRNSSENYPRILSEDMNWYRTRATDVNRCWCRGFMRRNVNSDAFENRITRYRQVYLSKLLRAYEITQEFKNCKHERISRTLCLPSSSLLQKYARETQTFSAIIISKKHFSAWTLPPRILSNFLSDFTSCLIVRLHLKETTRPRRSHTNLLTRRSTFMTVIYSHCYVRVDI